MDDRLRQLQLAELGILDEFIRVCEKHGLQYFLTGGTLLGAIRHQGFIPWDDDIDVAMPLKDYLRLLTLRNEFGPGYRLDSEALDEECPYNYSKLYDRSLVFDPTPGYGPPEIYIDIYPILPSRSPGRAARLCMNLISVMGYALQVKCGWDRYEPYKNKSAAFAYSVFRRLSAKQLRSLRRRFTRWLTSEGTGYAFSPGGKYGEKEIFPSDWFTCAHTAEFESRVCSVPADWDGFLRQHYGEYETLPDESGSVRADKGCRHVQG